MRKLCLVVFPFLASFLALAQKERIYVGVDKYSCRAGETIYLKSIILKGEYLSHLSTKEYVSLYRQDGTLLQRYEFPILSGQNIGQVVTPDSIPTDNYFIVASTRQQLGYDSLGSLPIPILIYNKEKPNRLNYKRLPGNNQPFTEGKIKGVDWTTSIQNGKWASWLEIDSGDSPRHLKLEMQSLALAADVQLDSSIRQKHAVFPVDSTLADNKISLYEYVGNDSVLIGSQFLHLRTQDETMVLLTDTLDSSPSGYNSWQLNMPDAINYYTNITVTDADKSIPSPVTIDQLNASRTDDLTKNPRADSRFITFSGVATRESGKQLRNASSLGVVVVGTNDSSVLFTKLMPIDSAGHFSLDSLFFFNSIGLQVQLNGEGYGNLRLHPESFTPPIFDSTYFDKWEDDSLSIKKEDTAFSSSEMAEFDLKRMKTLKTVFVKHRKNIREELDHKYTSGIFSEPTLFSYDLRSNDYYSLQDFLRANVAGIEFDPLGRPKFNGLSVVFYVKEQMTTWEFINSGSFWKTLAYAKVFRNDQMFSLTPAEQWNQSANDNAYSTSTMKPSRGDTGMPGPKLKNIDPKDPLVVALYAREGTDFRMLPSQLNAIPLRGYSEIVPFNPDRITLYCDRTAYGHTFRIRFTNGETTTRFRIRAEGVNYKGRVFHYESVVGPQ